MTDGHMEEEWTPSSIIFDGCHTTNCDVCDADFEFRVKLRRHNPSTQTAIYVMLIVNIGLLNPTIHRRLEWPL